MAHVAQTCRPLRNSYVICAFIDAILIEVAPVRSPRDIRFSQGTAKQLDASQPDWPTLLSRT
jgi:hypothetical protein